MKLRKNEKGSLALEQVLFIGAIVVMSIGLYAFYGNLSDYFSGVGFSSPPANVGGTPSVSVTP